ncbi:TatD family hydrolase [Candidatus Woesebacteria bacterium]|nr:TatD family hydrolase [Candidatus Woesebacteria bacterium]
MIIDTHCHYNLDPLYGPQGSTWQLHRKKAKEYDVSASVVVGTSIETSRSAIEISEIDPTLHAAVGLHPSLIAEEWLATVETIADEKKQRDSLENTIHQSIAALENLITTAPKDRIIALGEAGLDYFRLDETLATTTLVKDAQRTLFTAQIALAEKYSLPLILHVRDTGSAAYSTVLELLRTHKKSDTPFILHCVSGSVAYVQEALSLGAYIGVAGNVTYKNATIIQEIVRATPKNRILLETDAPFLPPTPHRGQPCEPWMISLTAQYLSEMLDGTLDQVVENTNCIFPRILI